MRFPQQFFSLFLVLVASALLAPDAAAQKNGSKYREFPAHGFEFKPLKDWTDVPVDQGFKSQGGIGKFDAERPISVKAEGNKRLNIAPSLRILKIVPQAATTEGGGGGGLRGRVGSEKAAEKGGKDYVSMLYGPALRKEEFKLVQPEVSTIKAKKIEGKREEIATYVVFNTGALDIVYDVYTFRLPDYKIVFVWDYPADKKLRKKWGKAIEKSMKTFRTNLDEIETSSVKSVNSESNYEDLLEFHTSDVAQTPGWHLVETPGKQYLIKTNSDKKKDIDLVIKRLEASRALYEQDFPPPAPIKSISVVRVCASEEDFHRYGNTSPGVAGWFNPGSEELVLYFGEGGKDSTLSVMTHEGFHQYCHFLFNRSEAHRWFDEGHGDYYGAWKLKGKKLVPNEDMKGGLARTPEIKTMIREGTVKPLKKHIRFDHGEWQGQGPSNVSCYAQSFSIIYFLREGARGKVNKKYWKEEYAEIIPNYMKHLAEGYQEAYDEIRKEAEEQIELLTEADAEFELIETAKKRAESPWDYLFTNPGAKSKIWAKAMGESWGKIDEMEFEERWLEFVMDEM
ncbi:MAG: hypothetical protein ACYSU1_02605 [Planctomycetota bacterium]|jgi:hypothetical protein